MSEYRKKQDFPGERDLEEGGGEGGGCSDEDGNTADSPS